MQRDMDLIRELMERLSTTDMEFRQIEGYEEKVIEYHLRLILDAGFLLDNTMTPEIPNEGFGQRFSMRPLLSWQGQEYYAAIHDKSVWDKIPDGVKMAPIEIIKGVAIELLKRQFFT